jgi:sulfur carrier protein ThiS
MEPDMNRTEQNLHEALAILGITATADAGSATDQKRVWVARDGSIVGRFDAHEGWEKLRTLTALVANEKAA